ncbi:hypothetical protein HPB50_018230 [Hyalomma asiaticum]|uniref:Uncharacterized protein n=1 Tax=Hyalomma asiaticum TaxID=266040 RepID=A0ACB7SV15_HYAAI|nr:hypothetical protein HPB50_018230 [Hyalomma asiaticum]
MLRRGVYLLVRHKRLFGAPADDGQRYVAGFRGEGVFPASPALNLGSLCWSPQPLPSAVKRCPRKPLREPTATLPLAYTGDEDVASFSAVTGRERRRR